MRAYLFILLVAWLWLPFAAGAQSPTITAAEYFLDTDPGAGNGRAFLVPVSANVSIQTQVSLQGLPPGFHTVSVRFQDSNDNWSLAKTRLYLIENPPSENLKNTLTALEYFIDIDPGTGNGSKVNISPGAEASVAIPVNLFGLPEGFHNVGLRFQDQAGSWSLTKTRLFLVQSLSTDTPLLPVTAAEYFIGTDPGLGLGKSLAITSGNNPQVVGNIALEGLERGFHNIAVRFKSQDNTWGLAKSRLFYVGDENLFKPVMVDYVEYFFDDSDPGEGKATSIPLTQPASAISVEALLAVAALPKGSHTITVRIRDNQGMWSRVKTENFIVGDPQFTVPPVPDLAELPNFTAECIVNLADLTPPTAKAEDGTAVIGTVNESLFPISKQGNTEITWTYTDSNNLKSTQKQLFVLEDKTAPELNAPAKLVLNLGENQCSVSGVQLGEAVASDNCGEPTVTNNAPGTFGVGITTVTWTATDAAGNQVQDTQEVEVIDAILPILVAPAALNVIIPAGQDNVENLDLGEPTYSDNCGIQSVTNDAPETFPLGRTTVTWTVTDNSGNTATAPQQVTLTREVLPTITAPAAINANTDLGDCAAVISNLGTPTVTGDNIPDDGITNDAPISFPLGNTIVTWTVTDGNGNKETATQSVTVRDAEIPKITAPAGLRVSTGQSNCLGEGVVLGQALASDNCGVASVVNNAPATYPLGNTTVTWTVTDTSGNIATAIQTVTVIDEKAPAITAPPAMSVQIRPDQETASGVSLGQPVVSDNCSVQSTKNDAPTLFPLGLTTVTWTVTDGSGNTATAQQQVTVTREQLPTITAPANIIVGNEEGTCEASEIDLGTPTVTGEDIPTDGITNDSPDIFPVGITTVTWTVTDGNGNTSTAEQTVTVSDNQKPVISAPANITVGTDIGDCSARSVNLGQPEFSDNCSIASVINNAPATFPIGETQVMWTATDDSGNTQTDVQFVTVEDLEAPTITAPADLTINTGTGSCVAINVNLGNPSGTDNCAVSSFANDAPDIFPIGVTVVNWSVMDANGNFATASQSVTVVDNELPTISAPGNLTVQVDPGSSVATNFDLGNPTVSDNCEVANITNDAPENFPIGSTTVTWTATDASGNSATAKQTVTVIPEDSELPTITPPANVTVNTDIGNCEATEVNIGTAGITGDIPDDGLINDAPAVFPFGVTIVTWTVTDVKGNIAEATQTVTVVDNQKPQISAPANFTVGTDTGDCSASTVNLGQPVFSDNCSIASVTNNRPLTFPLGETLVIWTAVDGSGNSDTATQLVTVEDLEAPSIQAPANLTTNTDTGSCDAIDVVLGNPTTEDNCIVAFVENDAPESFPIGETLVIWTVTDANGNTATASQTITVVDNELPTISAPGNITVLVDEGSDTATDLDLGMPTVSDNCELDDVINDAPVTFPIGTTEVTWTATDNAGNSSTSIQTVTVNPRDGEVELPTITAPPNIIVNTDKGLCEASNVNLGIATFTGNIPVLTNDAPGVYPLGVTTITWKVTDVNGNMAEATQTVTVLDKELPEIKAPANLLLAIVGEHILANEVDLGIPTYSDNCEVASVKNNAPSRFKVGTTIVKWTITDASGNICTAKQTVVVEKKSCTTIAKAIPEITLRLNKDGKARLTPEMVNAGSTSDCGPIKFDLSKCDFTCADLGEQIVKLYAIDKNGNRVNTKFKVMVVDETKPKISVDQTPFVWMMKSGDTFVMPDFRDRTTASDNCSFELTQTPTAGTVFRKPENCYVEFEAKDQSGNIAMAKFRFKLIVFKCRKVGKNSRETDEVTNDLLTVPWNTPLERAIAEGIEFEEGSDQEAISQLRWTSEIYDPLRPGFYQLHGTIQNTGFEGKDVSITVPVLVLSKAMPEDILLSNNMVSKNVNIGEIIGGLETIDPVDNIHTYSMVDNPDYYIEKGVLVCKGSGMPPLETTLRISSTDRAGQTISREIKVYREMDAPNDILIYPNPARNETNFHIRIAKGSQVNIRIFDAAGRQIYEEKGFQEGTFTRTLDIQSYASGMYQVIIQVDQHFIHKRLVKN